MRKLIPCLTMVWLAFSALAVDVTPLQSLAIQEGGRKKPLDTFARESLQKLVGRATWQRQPGERLTALRILADMTFGKEDWTRAKILKCGFAPLKTTLGLPLEQNFFSYAELATNAVLNRTVTEMNARREQTAKPVFTKVENEASTLWGKLHTLEDLVKGRSLRIVPPVPPQAGEDPGLWALVEEARHYHPQQADRIAAAFEAVRSAYRANDDPGFASAVGQFASLVKGLSPQVYPTDTELARELTYNRVHPFRLSWIFFLLAFVVMLAARRGTGFRHAFYWPAIALFAVGLGLQIYGFTLRCLIAGRPPVTNMYEVMIWIAFGAAFFALIFELIYKRRYFILAASAVCVASLVLADNLPAVLNPNIQPLVPVLRSNYWLTVHVLTITLGYAAFMLALGIGHIVLGYYVFKPSAKDKILELTDFNYRAMQVGVLFLTAGTILGGVWANDSWGRFWGWDPKETWALIAILCYLTVLHGRFAGWMGDFALNAASVLCFQAIIMAAYGVNYVLGTGLHSYGFGAGGEMAVACYVAAEIILVLLAVWRHRFAATVQTAGV